MQSSIGKVFISHSSKDKNFVDRFISDLTAHGIPVWYDKLDIKIGDSVPGKINIGLSEAKYFLIVLSPDSIDSLWVQEELNAALMRQIVSNGTFVIPILIRDCAIPPLLAHRRYADFCSSYEDGLAEVLAIWDKDADAIEKIGNQHLFPWPNIEVSDKEFVYLYSTRFDKFFRMNCELHWTVKQTLDHIIDTLDLPRNKELPELGMRWSFRYGLVFESQSISLSKTLSEAGVNVGNTLQISISGNYEDLHEKQLNEMWDGKKMWKITTSIGAQANLRKAIEDRGDLTKARLKEIADSCFDHLRSPRSFDSPSSTNRKVKTKTIAESRDVIPNYVIKIDYPQLEGSGDSSESEINALLKKPIFEKVHEFKRLQKEDGGLGLGVTGELTALYTVTLLSHNLLSLNIHFSEYTGGNSVSEWKIPFNYQLNPIVPIHMCQLFKAGLPREQIDSMLCRHCNMHMRRLFEAEEDPFYFDSFLSPSAFTVEDADDLRIFNLTDESIIFSFYAYLGRWWQAKIPYEEIKDYLDEDGILRPYLR